MSTPKRREYTKARRYHQESLADLQNAVNHPGPHESREAWLREAVAQERADFEALRRAQGETPEATRARKNR
jgi:hypothetical protein